jgi:hypothetical protein
MRQAWQKWDLARINRCPAAVIAGVSAVSAARTGLETTLRQSPDMQKAGNDPAFEA